MDLKKMFKDVNKKQESLMLAERALNEALLDTFAPLFSRTSPIRLDDSSNPEWLLTAMVEPGHYPGTNIFVLSGIKSVEFFSNAPCVTKWKAKAIPISQKTAKRMSPVILQGSFLLRNDRETATEANQRFFDFVKELLKNREKEKCGRTKLRNERI